MTLNAKVMGCRGIAAPEMQIIQCMSLNSSGCCLLCQDLSREVQLGNAAAHSEKAVMLAVV